MGAWEIRQKSTIYTSSNHLCIQLIINSTEIRLWVL